MKFTRRDALALSLLALTAANAAAQGSETRNTLILETKHGKVVIKLRPGSRAQARRADQDAGGAQILRRPRVPPGDRRLHGADRRSQRAPARAAPTCPIIPAEFSPTPFKRGTVGMARAQDPNSANSQFFICLADAPFLDGKYTVFGEVVSGMDVVDKIKKGTQDNNGAVDRPRQDRHACASPPTRSEKALPRDIRDHRMTGAHER